VSPGWSDEGFVRSLKRNITANNGNNRSDVEGNFFGIQFNMGSIDKILITIDGKYSILASTGLGVPGIEKAVRGIILPASLIRGKGFGIGILLA